MKRQKQIVWWLAVMLPVLLWGPVARAQITNANAGSGGILLASEGRVEVLPAGLTTWNAAQVNQTLKPMDRVRTGFKSRATIRLSDQSVLRLNQLTTLEIQPPAAEAKKCVLDLKAGAAYFYNREAAGTTEFRTPVATGAIRGTEFHLAVGENGRTELALLDGEVTMNNPLGEITLKSGEQGVVEKDQPPRKTALLDAKSVIQWALYYPGVLDLDELELPAAVQSQLQTSLAAYRTGDLLQALANYPENRTPTVAAEKIYLAGLMLAVGRVDETESLLKSLVPEGAGAATQTALANALRQVIAVVKDQPWTRSLPAKLATEWLAESYAHQSQFQLEAALQDASQAAKQSPQFGFAWVRLAELEFGFGHTDQALSALEHGLRLSPRNAQAQAVNGFVWLAKNQVPAAQTCFEQAIALDGALGNAWLGRGLCRIHAGQSQAGRADLQTAAALEPNRAIFRSYLGKAYQNEGDVKRAYQEMDLAKRLDPRDPTAWLYSALLNQQQNQINDSVSDLEKSKELNDNRRVYRSRLLLDQDQAVRSANLAASFRDAGMLDYSVREASRAVNLDYANYSAHLFLAESFDALRDPKQINLRYETPWMSELLLANLLSPVGAGNLSQNISQQEYTRMFEGNRLGFSSVSEYFSSGDWQERGSQFGAYGPMSYAFDVNYRAENGQRRNNDLESLTWFSKVKFQITPQDSLLLQTIYYDYSSGDVAQYYNQHSNPAYGYGPSATQRVTEKQEPIVLAGYHREWSPGNHTLFLAGRLDDTLTLQDANRPLLVVDKTAGTILGDYRNPPFRPTDLDYRLELAAFSSELQQIWQQPRHLVVAGARYQTGESDTSSQLRRPPGSFPLFLSNLNLAQANQTDLDRFNIYSYYTWQILEPLSLTAGVAYDRINYPKNVAIAPITSEQQDKDQVSPKAGLTWSPLPDTHFRAIYSHSLGGVFYDNSVRLEPTQIAGFDQAFRSLIPESVVGLVPGSRFKTWGVALDQAFKTRTYLSVMGEFPTSDAERTFGVFNRTSPTTALPSSTPEQLAYREKTLRVTANQLVSQEWSLGATYRLSQANLEHHYPEFPSSPLNAEERAVLHQMNLYAIYQHRCGFFTQFDSVWSLQSNAGYAPDLPGDDFWQFNLYAGYRFPQRHAEVRVGLLNLSDRDYQLNPLNLYSELPRERTFIVSLKLNF